MAGGSQLTQLKSAIHGAGLARSNSSGSKKKRAGGGGGKAKSSMGDPDARKKKLEAISQSLNSFDVKTSKTKHAILGARPLKGSTGRPGLSRQVGIENRKKTLLPQLLDRDRSGGVVDRRFGEGDASLTPEEKAIQRFALERQRRAGKAALFNLGDNEENGLGLLGEGDDDNGGDMLTHFGQSLASVRGALPDQEEFFQKSGRPGPAARGALALEGGGDQAGRDAADAGPQRKKSRAEVMEEVIAKSKAYKYERQRVRTEDDEIRLALDDDLAGIRALLGAPNLRSRTGESTSAAPKLRGEEAVLVPSASDAPEASDAQDGNESEEENEAEDDEDQEGDDNDAGSDHGELDDGSDASSAGDAEAQAADTTLASQAAPSHPAPSGSGIKLTFVKAPVDSDGTAGLSGTASSGVDRSLLAGLLGADIGDVDHAEDDAEEQTVPLRRRHRRTEEDDVAEANTDDPYDRFVRELAFEKRAAPSDRLRTPAEVAQEAAAQLQKSELRRLKRMRGEEDDSASDDAERSDDELSSHKRKKSKAGKSARRAEGDDLGDDFNFEGDEVRGFGLGGGLAVEDTAEEAEEGDEGDLEAEGESEEDDEGEEEDEEEDGESDVGSEKDENEMLADLLHGDELSAEEEGAEDAISALVKPARKGKGKRATTSRKELPYTFPCPATHEELLDLLDGTDEQDLPVVIERIRTLYHPSLAEGNKQKLATFLTVLVDHLLYTAATSSFAASSALLPHIMALSQSFPITFSNAVVSKLTLMQKNLARGLASGPLLPTSKTWPGPGELALLRLVGVVFSTSDFSHVVAAPALLLVSQYLGQCRLRTLSDLASGLFLCTLALQYESMSKRVVPEAVNFLAQAAALLFPMQPAVPLEHGSYPMPDLDREDVGTLLRLQEADDDTRSDELDLLQLLHGAADAGAARVGLAKIAITLISEFSGLYNTLPAFIELFDPILRSLLSIELVKLPPSVQRKLSSVSDSLGRMLKFSRQARRPLTLQSHKPIPIPSFLPKFEEGYAPGRRFDPDSERNEASKLKALVKKERKGAVRELRKDNRFLAGERQKIQREKDAEYKGKINRITAGLEKERHEEKRFARTKEIERTRDKKRAGEAGGSRGGRGGRGGGRGGGGGRGASRGGRGGRGRGA